MENQQEIRDENQEIDYFNEELDEEVVYANIRRIDAETETQLAMVKQSDSQVLINKVEELRLVLVAQKIDENRTTMSSEPYYTSILNSNERNTVMKKMLELINKF